MFLRLKKDEAIFLKRYDYFPAKIYSGGEPELVEGGVFRTIVPMTEIHVDKKNFILYNAHYVDSCNTLNIG